MGRSFAELLATVVMLKARGIALVSLEERLDRDKVTAALKLVAAGLSPTAAARQLGLGRSTVYREVSRAGSRKAM